MPDGTRRTPSGHADGGVLGWAAASAVSTRPLYAGVVEHSVYVAAAERGRGVGASLRLHEATGFRVIGRRERVARMSHGSLAGGW